MKQTIAKDLYTIYLGDCIEIMQSMESSSIDTIITDLPYGNNTNYDVYQDTRENLIELISRFIPEATRVAKRVAITCGVNNIHLYPEPAWILSWHSPNSNSYCKWGFSCWQPILVYGKDPFLSKRMGCRPDSFIYSNLTRQKIEHPCPKPLELMKKIVWRCSLEGDTILDPFMGSGMTGIASILLKRKFIGMEISKSYFELALDLLSQTAIKEEIT